jgi:hypothetical protein
MGTLEDLTKDLEKFVSEKDLPILALWLANVKIVPKVLKDFNARRLENHIAGSFKDLLKAHKPTLKDSHLHKSPSCLYINLVEMVSLSLGFLLK